ncbi:MAG: hypothetical protein FWC32_01270 [Firmicutes bacterium]|nr:hypothetical protein [Bacillota bacterium]
MTKKQQLYYLLEAFQRGEYDIATFCDVFYTIFYPDIPSDELTTSELSAFEALGRIVARFSPYEEDIKLHPNAFYTEDGVKNAIEVAYSELALKKQP